MPTVVTPLHAPGRDVTSPAITDRPDSYSQVYGEYFGFLIEVAVYKFKVPSDAAQDVVQEVFLTYWTVQHRVLDTKAWLVAGVCNASRRYWIKYHKRREELIASAPELTTDHEAFLREVSVRQIVDRLEARCKTTLCLHYFEGATAREVALHLGTTHKYAEKLIHQCLRRAFEAWDDLWRDG